jgi:hypothetical protein
MHPSGIAFLFSPIAAALREVRFAAADPEARPAALPK